MTKIGELATRNSQSNPRITNVRARHIDSGQFVLRFSFFVFQARWKPETLSTGGS
jgi:hypothetical protein